MLDMRRVYVPLHPGLFSALGLLLADVRYDYVQSIPGPLDALDIASLRRRFDSLLDGVRTELKRDDLDRSALRVERYLDLRYRGQTSERTMALPDGDALSALELAERFHAEHERSYGYRCPAEPVMVVNLRLKTFAPSRSIGFSEVAEAFRREAQGAVGGVTIRRRNAYFGPKHGERDARILSRADLMRGPVEGPLIVEEFDTTVAAPPGWSASLDQFASIVLEPVE
jgi:N-methylhydantoinase A